MIPAELKSFLTVPLHFVHVRTGSSFTDWKISNLFLHSRHSYSYVGILSTPFPSYDSGHQPFRGIRFNGRAMSIFFMKCHAFFKKSLNIRK